MRGRPQHSLLDRALVWRPRRALFSSVCWLGRGPECTDRAGLTGEYSANPRREEIREYREVVELGGKRESLSQSGCSGSHKEENPWTGQTDWPTGNNSCHCIRWPNRWPCSMTSFMVNRRDSLDQTSPVPVSKLKEWCQSTIIFSPHVDKAGFFRYWENARIFIMVLRIPAKEKRQCSKCRQKGHEIIVQHE